MQDKDDSVWLDRFTRRPMQWFLMAFISSIAVLWIVLQIVAILNMAPLSGLLGALAPNLVTLEVSSVALQAVVGTAVVGASAVVALLVAVAALRASQQSNALALNQNKLADHQNVLARQANELSDPDYVLSHDAYSAYRKYGFLVGSLIASYRSFRHERELENYPMREDETMPLSRRWSHASTLTELRTLILHTPFQVAALEAAKLIDKRAATTGNAGYSDIHQHNLRKSFADFLGALERHINDYDMRGASPEQSFTGLLAQASILDRELKRGIDAVTNCETALEPHETESSLVLYLKRWMGRIEPVQLGEDFASAVRANAFADEEFAKFLNGKLESWQGKFASLLDEVFVDNAGWTSAWCTDPFGNGLHRAMRIAALCGDHTTPLKLRDIAEDYAKKRGWRPELVVVHGMSSLPPPSATDSDVFYIFHVTRRTLLYLFDGELLGPNTRGCVIVDGVRSNDLAFIEAEIADIYFPDEQWEVHADLRDDQRCETCGECHVCGGCTVCGTCERVDATNLDRLIQMMTMAAYRHTILDTNNGMSVKVKRETSRLAFDRAGNDIDADTDMPAPQGPRMVWVGIDYRKIGVEPPTRMANWHCEMWSAFEQNGVSVSEEIHELTKL